MKSNKSSPQALQITSEIFENFSLHIDDVEFLHNAFIVQALSGFLIRFSNRGRYEPYIAKSWTHENNVWSFKLHPNLTCENGQPIDAYSFKKSLLRSFKRFSEDEIKETPFVNLQGINNFIKNQKISDLEGLQATDNETLNFSFTKHAGKSLLEYLAMTPFAFQCDDNFIDGQWKSKNQFISSGPYRILNYKPESNSCCTHNSYKISGSGLSCKYEIAKKIAFSELNERHLVLQLQKLNAEVDKWGLKTDSSCSGFAIGYSRESTILRSVLEGKSKGSGLGLAHACNFMKTIDGKIEIPNTSLVKIRLLFPHKMIS